MKNSKYKYCSDENYYFVSINRGGRNPAWIRSGFLTSQEVQEWINVCSVLNKTYKNLQIYPEQVLEQTIALDDTTATSSITLREALFGYIYAADNEYYLQLKRGETDFSWKDGYDEWMKGQSITQTVVNP
jgi:hypothetical protein